MLFAVVRALPTSARVGMESPTERLFEPIDLHEGKTRCPSFISSLILPVTAALLGILCGI